MSVAARTMQRGVAVLLGLALTAEAHAQGRPAAVEVDPVSLVEVAETQPLIARIVAMAESVVATRVPGIVEAVEVEVGDRIERGATLAALDTELLQIELDGAEATLLEAQAGLQSAQVGRDLAEQVYERTGGLRDSAAFSQGRFDDLAQELARSRAEVARAEAAIAIARSSVASARYRLENATIRASFAGVVLERGADPGDYLEVGASVAAILDDARLEIEADVPTEIVAALDPGDTVGTMIDDGPPGEATVRALIPTESPTTRTRPVRFSIDLEPTEKRLAPGQSVTVLAPVGDPREALSVEKDALVQRAGGWLVFVVADGKATPREVTLGTAIGERIEVGGALAPGDLVVVRGNERLQPGQAVAYETPETVAAGSASAGAKAAQP